jgi:hypothetical protein
MATTVTLKPNAIDLSGSTSGTTTLQATAVAGTTTITLPAATDTLVGKATTDTLTNKTLTTPVISTISNTGTLTLPTSTDTLVGRATTDTLTNKTLTTPVISSLSSASATALTLQSAGTTAITVDTSQNVGIGTTSPSTYSAKLAVVASSGVANQWLVGGASSGAYAYFSNNAQSSTANTMQVGQGWASGSDNIGFLNTNGANPILFATNGTERMRIDSSGNLLVGRTTQFLDGQYSSNFNGNSKRGATYNNTFANDGANFISFGSNGTQIGGVSQSGGSAVLYNVTSDQRLKENIADADSASTLIDSLQVRKFDWKSDNSHQRYGFVAQELVTVAPEAVHQPENTEEMMAVDYSKLVPMLVKEIQSLRQRLSAANL